MAYEQKRNILVPWDFSPDSDVALQHAVQLASQTGDTVTLVHFLRKPSLFGGPSKQTFLARYEEKRTELNRVVDERTQSVRKDLDALRAKIREDQYSNREVQDVTLVPVVMEYTNLPNDLRAFYGKSDTNLVVTPYNYQLEGGKSLDLLKLFRQVGSGRTDTVPYIVVRKPPLHAYYTNMVVPVEYDRHYKEAFGWVVYLAKYYRCNVNLLRASTRDEVQKKSMANNLYFAKKILGGQDIVYGVKSADKGREFSLEVGMFMAQIDADILLVMTDKVHRVFPSGKVDSDRPVIFINPLVKRLSGFN